MSKARNGGGRFVTVTALQSGRGTDSRPRFVTVTALQSGRGTDSRPRFTR